MMLTALSVSVGWHPWSNEWYTKNFLEWRIGKLKLLNYTKNLEPISAARTSSLKADLLIRILKEVYFTLSIDIQKL